MSAPPGRSMTLGGSIQALTADTLLKTTTNVLLVSLKICSANAQRKGFVIFNNSANSTYVCLDGPAASATCARLIATFASWECYGPVIWSGELYAIRNAGSGQVVVWEIF